MNDKRQEKYNATILEHTYMLAMLSLIRDTITSNEYNELKRQINDEYLKSIYLYEPLDYIDFLNSKKNLLLEFQ